MTKKAFRSNLIMSAVALFSVISVGVFNNSKTKGILTRSFDDPYSIVFDASTNKVGSEAYVGPETGHSGTGFALTGLNNPITFNYVNFTNQSGMWQNILSGGSLTNTQPISGMSKLSIVKKTTDASLKVYWSTSPIFDEVHSVVFDTSSALLVETTFAGDKPNFFKLSALTSSQIDSMVIEFDCVATYDVDDVYKLGTYPQTKVTDNALIETLNISAGTLPSPSNPQSWTSYQYYISGSNTTDFMWYQDVSAETDMYRGVYFTSYRPKAIDVASNDSNSYQDDNGYYINNRYWFKFEPISWDVLSVDEEAGPLVLSSKIIDCQEYYHSSSSRTIEGQTVYANNYKESNVRKWINESFFNTAFSSTEQNLIKTTNVDNSVYSTGHDPNQYSTTNTNDKLFLPSYREVEVMNAASRVRSATDYAKAMGVFVYTSSGKSDWWLRSPHTNFKLARVVSHDGGVYDALTVSDTRHGLVPAFRINR